MMAIIALICPSQSDSQVGKKKRTPIIAAFQPTKYRSNGINNKVNATTRMSQI